VSDEEAAMTRTVTERHQDLRAEELGPSLMLQPSPPTRRLPTAPALAAAGGLLVAALAAGGLLADRARSEPGPAAPIAVSTDTFPDVGVSHGAYEAGHSSGWHVHPGLHSVVVLEGTLTVYDAACVRHQFRPGETYLGGDHPHVARNEEPEPLRFAVTYVFSRSPDQGPGHAVPPPACGASVR
jgi:hypothetical protein